MKIGGFAAERREEPPGAAGSGFAFAFAFAPPPLRPGTSTSSRNPRPSASVRETTTEAYPHSPSLISAVDGRRASSGTYDPPHRSEYAWPGGGRGSDIVRRRSSAPPSSVFIALPGSRARTHSRTNAARAMRE